MEVIDHGGVEVGDRSHSSVAAEGRWQHCSCDCKRCCYRNCWEKFWEDVGAAIVVPAGAQGAEAYAGRKAEDHNLSLVDWIMSAGGEHCSVAVGTRAFALPVGSINRKTMV